ncbi:MAG: phosphatidate cytidylyltransferase [Burkholderiaceae bacterium]|nr:phosphatidate cytidylyltransferase [Burkholderiaceae bacterium]
MLSVLFFLVLVAAAWEWSRLIAPNASYAAYFYALVCAMIVLFLGLFAIPTVEIALLSIALAFWLIGMPMILSQGIHLSLLRWRFIFSVLGFIILPTAWLSLDVLREIGLWWLLSALILVWLADIGAYFVGKSFGRRKLASQISPGKSVEGAVGGLVLCLIYATACAWYFPAGDTLFGASQSKWGWGWMLLMTVILVAYSIMGDLFESQLKRIAKVKDSSHLLPGHGGFLDRVDALLPVMPIAALFSIMVRS